MKSQSYWRNRSRMAIKSAIESMTLPYTEKELKKAIDVAYPFGERLNHPYKIWLDERLKAFEQLGFFDSKPNPLFKKRKNRKTKLKPTPEGQLSLF